MGLNKATIADSFFSMIKNLSADVKLELIGKISDSLKEEKGNHEDAWKNLFGAWESEENAEDIIGEIRTSRYTNRQIEDF
ncbi:hypothetical protein [Catalinimonas niigatensis]|uniref:hypothetical protein n=1 Tax=Catalinimonas niigatensis TaxID=1397264 RepID=UPI002666FD40|nr:hypothetical protein [Catalinimonas niigatensis]WPP52365.1 hypothetical protein PZB72_08220 [Catalinimonas niigatensis]